MLNNGTWAGRLTASPSLSYTPDGKAVATFTIATDRPYNTDKADFIPIEIWGKSAENCANVLSKGDIVGVPGRIKTDKFDKDGKTNYTWVVVADNVNFISVKKWQNTNTPETPQNGDNGQNNPFEGSKEYKGPTPF